MSVDSTEKKIECTTLRAKDKCSRARREFVIRPYIYSSTQSVCPVRGWQFAMLFGSIGSEYAMCIDGAPCTPYTTRLSTVYTLLVPDH